MQVVSNKISKTFFNFFWWFLIACSSEGSFYGIAEGKVICHSGMLSPEFQGKAPHTLLIPENGVASIEPVATIPEGVAYAISGAPVISDGKRVSYQTVHNEGWNETVSYPGMHGFIGLSGRTILYIAFSTQSPNLFESGEAFWKLSPLGLKDVIEVGGRGCVIKAHGRLKTSKGENKMINTIVTF